MKYHTPNNMLLSRLHILLTAIAVCLCAVAVHADDIPDCPNPPRLVVDYAGLLSPGQLAAMEDSLETFARKTSNRIAVVTITDLGSLTPMEMAYGIGQKWGVGDKKHNAGAVLLVKPKTADSQGQVFIATGYGVEGVLTDAYCSQIIRHEIIPHFSQGDYYGGIEAALAVMKPAMAGELSEEQYLNGDDDNLAAISLVLAIVIVIVLIAMSRKDNSGNSGNSGTLGGGGPIYFGPIGGSGRRSRSSGGSSWGGSSGGFGGFGGGSFGGGGAGGSW